MYLIIFFDEIQISYVRAEKDTNVREHFKQAKVVCNDFNQVSLLDIEQKFTWRL